MIGIRIWTFLRIFEICVSASAQATDSFGKYMKCKIENFLQVGCE